MRNDAIGVPFFASIIIHIFFILCGSIIIHDNPLRRRDLVPIDLVDIPLKETPPPAKKVEATPEIKKPLPPPEPKVKKPKLPSPVAKARVIKPEVPPPLRAPVKEELEKTVEIKPPVTAKLDPPTSLAPGARVEGGGSEAGAGNLFGKGDVAVVPGTGTSGGGGGSASAGLGRGSGTPGPPNQAVLKTNREAKAIQTVRAVYPPMALRMGMESDVMLRIEVDPTGKVIKAEITKSGGAGFDEEALKAVKQSRFEAAQRDGQNVPAEFTYIYRFRLQR